MPTQYGIIGYPLSHSFSPAYFRKKFAALHSSAVYDAYPIANIEELPALLDAHPGMRGLNVTIPYKETIIPFLHEIDPMAAEIGAVNCIAIDTGYRKGYNTDAIGFEQSLVPLLRPQHTRALVLGTGGASKAVLYALSQLGIAYTQVSRGKGEALLTYEELTADVMMQHKLIINTTPVGTYPNADEVLPLPYNGIGAQHLLYDLIYNPEETRFLAYGRERGAAVKNGFEMLVLQAEASWKIWNSVLNSEE